MILSFESNNLNLKIIYLIRIPKLYPDMRPAILKRELGPISATNIVVANMIGAGILTTTGLMANYLPNFIWIFGCWIFGGLIALSGALCYAELGSRMPEEGGEYVYLKKYQIPPVVGQAKIK